MMPDDPIRLTKWTVPSGTEKDKRVFVVTAKKPIHVGEVEYCLNRWKEKTFSLPSAYPEVIEIEYETWLNGPQ